MKKSSKKKFDEKPVVRKHDFDEIPVGRHNNSKNSESFDEIPVGRNSSKVKSELLTLNVDYDGSYVH